MHNKFMCFFLSFGIVMERPHFFRSQNGRKMCVCVSSSLSSNSNYRTHIDMKAKKRSQMKIIKNEPNERSQQHLSYKDTYK